MTDRLLLALLLLTLVFTGCTTEPRQQQIESSGAADALADDLADDPDPEGVSEMLPQPPAPVEQAGPADSADRRVVATVGGRAITMGQLTRPLIEAHGLPVLMILVQGELTAEIAEQNGLVITDEVVEAEEHRTLDRLFPREATDERPALTREDQYRLLPQLLQSQGTSQHAWDNLMRVNATLRELARPEVEAQLTEENVRTSFNVLYGEKVSVRHIQLASLQDVPELHRQLEERAFADVARDMSLSNTTAPLGGEYPPFTRNESLPEAFKDAAFALEEPGDISEPVQVGDSYHVMQLIGRIPPETVRYEDVRDGVRENLETRLMDAQMSNLRQQIELTLLRELEIVEPELGRQYEEFIEQQRASVREEQAIRDAIDSDFDPDTRAPREPLRAGQTGPPALPADALDPDNPFAPLPADDAAE